MSIRVTTFCFFFNDTATTEIYTLSSSGLETRHVGALLSQTADTHFRSTGFFIWKVLIIPPILAEQNVPLGN